MYKDKD